MHNNSLSKTRTQHLLEAVALNENREVTHDNGLKDAEMWLSCKVYHYLHNIQNFLKLFVHAELLEHLECHVFDIVVRESVENLVKMQNGYCH